MATRTNPRTRFEVRDNPPALVRTLASGRERTRALRPRTRLTYEEAAAVLDRPREYIVRAVRSGLLRSVRSPVRPALRRVRRARLRTRLRRRRFVTFGACLAFLRGEASDGRAAVAAMNFGGPSIPAHEVYRRLGI